MWISKKTKIITTIIGLLAIATTALILFLDSAKYICDDELLKFVINKPEGDVKPSGEFLIRRTCKLPDIKEIDSHYLVLEEEFNDLETVAVSTIGEWQDKKIFVETQILG